MKRKFRIINCDHGPNFCGAGDLALMIWCCEGTIGTSDEVRVRTDNKIEVLKLFGKENFERPIGLSPKQIFGIEKECRANIPRVDQIRKHFGITAEPKRPKLHIPQAAREYAEVWWRFDGGFGVDSIRVLLCQEVNDKSRRWPWFHNLESEVSRLGYSRFLTKLGCDESWANAAAIIDMADVVVAVDSAYAHIAATLGKKTIVIMGPTRSTAYAHAADCVTCLTPPEDDPCTGCVYNEPFHERNCGHIGCAQIGKITPERVFEEVSRCLSR